MHTNLLNVSAEVSNDISPMISQAFSCFSEGFRPFPGYILLVILCIIAVLTHQSNVLP